MINLNKEDSARVARSLSFLVVLKIHSQSIIHKSDAHGASS